MSKANYSSAAFTNAAGVAVAANATIEVRREIDGALATIWSDDAGASAIAQPGFVADSNGRFTFYAAGSLGGYRIAVTKDAVTHTVFHQPIGTAGEVDVTAYTATFLGAADNAAMMTLLGTQSTAATNAAIAAATNKIIYGWTYANNSGDATNDIDIAAGGGMDSTGVHWIEGAASTKRLDAAWAVGSGNGGLSTGTIANTDYYIWAIKRLDTGVVDYLFNVAGDPTYPTNYTVGRVAGWFKRVGGVIVGFKTYALPGGGLELLWNAPTLDINLANTLTTTRRTDAVKVPLTFSVIAHINVYVHDASAQSFAWICCPDQTDAAPSGSAAPLANTDITIAGDPSTSALHVRTSATGTIAARANLATVDTYLVSTMGFQWARRG